MWFLAESLGGQLDSKRVLRKRSVIEQEVEDPFTRSNRTDARLKR
jgi:hypothetical protein